jgi:hypothetical protein
MAVVWTLNATAVPAIQVPSALVAPSAAVPLLASTIPATGNVITTPLNTNAVHLDNVGIVGGTWARSIIHGLGFTENAGLTLTIGVGAAHVGAVPTVLEAAYALALTDNAENYIWLQRSGVPTKVIGATTAPASSVYLGRVTTLAGAKTAYDHSGRLENRGGTLYRRTADAGAPGDTPPSGIMFIHRTAGGRYLWDGDAYTAL